LARKGVNPSEVQRRRWAILRSRNGQVAGKTQSKPHLNERTRIVSLSVPRTASPWYRVPKNQVLTGPVWWIMVNTTIMVKLA